MTTYTTEQKVAEAAKIIRAGALEFMANKEGISVTQVCELILAGHAGAVSHFTALVSCGINEAMGLHDQGKISLIG